MLNNATVGLIYAQGRSVVLQVISDGNAKHFRCSFRRVGNQVQFGLNEIDLVAVVIGTWSDPSL